MRLEFNAEEAGSWPKVFEFELSCEGDDKLLDLEK